jgi:hypothetical protein
MDDFFLRAFKKIVGRKKKKKINNTINVHIADNDDGACTKRNIPIHTLPNTPAAHNKNQDYIKR